MRRQHGFSRLGPVPLASALLGIAAGTILIVLGHPAPAASMPREPLGDEAREGAKEAPPHPGFERLERALASLRKTARSGGWTVVPDGPPLSSKSRDERVSMLRRRLGLRAGTTWDDRLTGRVRAFQERHGLRVDGIVGPGTLAEMNVPVERRIRQVELNLERWRRLPPDLGNPHIFVNIPGFEMAWVADGKVAWQARIVAGTTESPTPVLSDRIVSVVTHPAWLVPDTIALEEYLPALREDPAPLLQAGFHLIERDGDGWRDVDPAGVDWDAAQGPDLPWRLKQDPGPTNPLGRIKFVMTNDQAIYIHDTPQQDRFRATRRDVSHGCIRVEKAAELAALVMRDSGPGWREALDDESDEERAFPVRPPVSVHIVYLTAWVDEDGEIHFAPDIYELDGP